MNVLDRFLRYVKVHSTSGHSPDGSFPSTPWQLDMARLLLAELKEMGIADAAMDEFGYVTGSIPSNLDHKVPAVGFIAHYDTTPDLPGKDVKPRVIENYQGGDIVLNEELGIVTRVEEFPCLNKHIGHTLVVTDGTTLLGGDDKAGVADIMAAAEYLLAHPEIKHGDVKIAFSPDEEVGGSMKGFDIQKFGAEFAYTLDGGGLGGLFYENFNAASAHVIVRGTNIHPGSAKGKMLNAIAVAMEFDHMLPKLETAEATEGYEGYQHLFRFSGGVEKVDMAYILRDHDAAKLEAKKQFFRNVEAYLNTRYPAGTVTVQLADSYRNIREIIDQYPFLMEAAKNAYRAEGVEPKIQPMRGGTDGAALTYEGLPCPNLCDGSYNCHGRYEYVSVQEMQACARIVVGIVGEFAKM